MRLLKKVPKELKVVATSWEDNILNQPNPPKLPWSKTQCALERPIDPVIYVAEDSSV